MRKKKVVSVFSILILLALGLAIFSLYSFGSITGRVVDNSYSQELFAGSDYEFQFIPKKLSAQDQSAFIEGTLQELSGKDHSLQVTGYAFDIFGNGIGTLSKEIFLGSGSELTVKFAMPLETADIHQLLVYFEDDSSSIRVHKTFSSAQTITGNSINEDGTGKNALHLLVGVVILVGAVLFVVSRLKQHKRQENLETLFSHKRSRKYIDLDVR